MNMMMLRNKNISEMSRRPGNGYGNWCKSTATIPVPVVIKNHLRLTMRIIVGDRRWSEIADAMA